MGAGDERASAPSTCFRPWFEGASPHPARVDLVAFDEAVRREYAALLPGSV